LTFSIEQDEFTYLLEGIPSTVYTQTADNPQTAVLSQSWCSSLFINRDLLTLFINRDLLTLKIYYKNNMIIIQTSKKLSFKEIVILSINMSERPTEFLYARKMAEMLKKIFFVKTNQLAAKICHQLVLVKRPGHAKIKK